MNIKKITFCQNENWIYDKLPRRLDSDYNPLYEFQYPFSKTIALDCERIVYKLIENNISSDICRNLNIVFINENQLNKTELTDFIAFNQKDMRFVNTYVNSNNFNILSDEQKRKNIFDKIYEALILVSESDKANHIKQICNDVFLSSDETECIFLTKTLKKYTISVKFRSSFNGYTAILYINNNITLQQERTVLFENRSFADLEYRIHKIIIKKNQCIIHPKNNETDVPIIVNMDI